MEQIQTPQQTYDAAMDSVNLINAGNVSVPPMSDADWADTIKRNVEHLELQVAKGADYFGTLDLTPFTLAIAKGV